MFLLPEVSGLALFRIKVFTRVNSRTIPEESSVAPCVVFTFLVSLKMSGSVLFMKGIINIIKI